MRIPQQVSERMKEAPAQALRAVFSGIGQVLLVADRIRSSRTADPARARPDATGRPDQAGAAAPKEETRWRSLDETGNVRLLSGEDAAGHAGPPAPAADAGPATTATPAPAKPAAAKPPAPAKPAAAKPPAVPEPPGEVEPAVAAKPPAVPEPPGEIRPTAAAKAPVVPESAASKPTAAPRSSTPRKPAAPPAASKPAAAARKSAAPPTAAEPAAARPEPAAPPAAAPPGATEPAAPPGATEPAAPPAARERAAAASTDAAAEPVALPVPNYDDLTVASLRARLRNLDAAQVRALLDYEKAHAGRDDVLTMYERRIAKLQNSQA